MRSPSLRVLSQPPAQAQFAQATSSFLARCQARGLSEGTLEFYRIRLRRFQEWLAEQAPETGPDQATPDLVRRFLAAERERVSAAAAAKARTTLGVFFAHLVREGLVRENPMERVERVRVPQKLVRPLTEEEVERLLAAANPRTFHGVRLRALVLLLVDTGLRASEVCALDLSDLDLAGGLVRVRQAKGGRERQVPLGATARAALLSYLGRRGDLGEQQAVFVDHFGGRLDRCDLFRLLRRAGERAGIPGVGCHRFRHSAATFALRGGMNVFALQRLLGHRSLTMVRRYAEVAQSDLVAQHRQASPGDRFRELVKPAGRRRLR